MEEYRENGTQQEQEQKQPEYYQPGQQEEEPRKKQNSVAGYILVGILCLLLGIALGSCTAVVAVSGVKRVAEEIVSDDDDESFEFEWHFGDKDKGKGKREERKPEEDEEYQEQEKREYKKREMPALDGPAPVINDSANPWPDIIEQVSDGVVGVNTYEDYEGEEVSSSYGSGFVISSEGYILTNAHIVRDANRVTVTFPEDGEEETEAEIVGFDTTTDVAVLYVERQGLKPLNIGRSGDVRVGEFVVTIGNPSGDEYAGSATLGIVSATGRSVNVDGRENEYIQTDAAINPGSSGGPLINIKGEVIGITSAKNVFAGYDEYGNIISAEGLGFAMPIDKAVEIASELITEGHIVRPGMGVNVMGITAELAEEYDVDEGILIYSVTKNGPAHKAGLKVNDIVIAYDGIDATDQQTFVEYVKSLNVGDTISLTVIRDGEEKTIDVTLGDMNEMGSELVGNRESDLLN